MKNNDKICRCDLSHFPVISRTFRMRIAFDMPLVRSLSPGTPMLDRHPMLRRTWLNDDADRSHDAQRFNGGIRNPVMALNEASTSASSISVRFWGVRGSIACPGPTTLRYGGNTPCVEIRCGTHTLIFDAGTGIRPLGNALAQAGQHHRLRHLPEPRPHRPCDRPAVLRAVVRARVRSSASGPAACSPPAASRRRCAS